jgi:hypothetical protein
MRLFQALVVFLSLLPAAMAQKWEIGGGVGTGFYTSHDVTSPAGTASAKIGSNIAATAWVGNRSAKHWGGELRYNFQRGDLLLRQASTEASFGASSHALHYDFLYHFHDSEYSVRPFVAFGGGIKMFRGTGQEVLVQPLSRIALLTRAQDMVPMASVGAGFKVRLSDSVHLRLDVHDFMTPFPKEVIVPNGGSITAWMHDIVPMVGIMFAK